MCVKIMIQRHARAVLSLRKAENLQVFGAVQADVQDMNGIPTIRPESDRRRG